MLWGIKKYWKIICINYFFTKYIIFIMVKTINKDAFAIKALLKKGFSPIKVARILGLSSKKLIIGQRLRLNQSNIEVKNSMIHISIKFTS